LQEVDRLGEAEELAKQLLDDIELDRTTVNRQVLKAMRLARLVEDEAAIEWLNFEISGCPSNDAGDRHMTRTRRWTDQENNEGYWASTAALQAQIDATSAAVSAMRVESVSGDYLVPALRGQREEIASFSNIIAELGKVLASVSGLVHTFAARIYQELRFSAVQAELFESARQSVDARLAALGGDALTKIESINERFRAGDSEAISHAMTTARRMIESIVDDLFPATGDPYTIGDESFSVDNSKVLNRYLAFMHSKGVSGGRKKRLRTSLGEVYSRVSKGVHTDMDLEEARFVFLQTYVTLGEIVSIEG
jgi:hypothetical protein